MNNFRKISFYGVILFILGLMVSDIFLLGNAHTCQTSDDWIEDGDNSDYHLSVPLGLGWNSGEILWDEDSSESKFAHRWNRTRRDKWPGGVVTYRLNDTLTATDISELHLAFEEYHKKTCIRFKSLSAGEDKKYVSIERDDKVCGLSEICMRPSQNYQYARIGQYCGNKASFVHELGHTLCLGHEHQRRDRDAYLSFNNHKYCQDKPPQKQRGALRHYGIYDYASQMHYNCSTGISCDQGYPTQAGWYKCGEQIHNGLSVMDADTVNALYNCQGCHRHRWIPFQILKENKSRHQKNMYSFGHVDMLGRALYPCRVSYGGQVQVGMYTHEEQSCRILSRFDKKNVIEKHDFEVLTIPGGLTGCKSTNSLFQYQLANIRLEAESDILETAVPAGMGLYKTLNFVPTTFVAFSTLSWKQYSGEIAENGSFSHHESASESGENDDAMDTVVDVIGTVWGGNGNLSRAVFFTASKLSKAFKSFKVLVCK